MEPGSRSSRVLSDARNVDDDFEMQTGATCTTRLVAVAVSQTEHSMTDAIAHERQVSQSAPTSDSMRRAKVLKQIDVQAGRARIVVAVLSVSAHRVASLC